MPGRSRFDKRHGFDPPQRLGLLEDDVDGVEAAMSDFVTHADFLSLKDTVDENSRVTKANTKVLIGLLVTIVGVTVSVMFTVVALR